MPVGIGPPPNSFPAATARLARSLPPAGPHTSDRLESSDKSLSRAIQMESRPLLSASPAGVESSCGWESAHYCGGSTACGGSETSAGASSHLSVTFGRTRAKSSQPVFVILVHRKSSSLRFGIFARCGMAASVMGVFNRINPAKRGQLARPTNDSSQMFVWRRSSLSRRGSWGSWLFSGSAITTPSACNSSRRSNCAMTGQQSEEMDVQNRRRDVSFRQGPRCWKSAARIVITMRLNHSRSGS